MQTTINSLSGMPKLTRSAWIKLYSTSSNVSEGTFTLAQPYSNFKYIDISSATSAPLSPFTGNFPGLSPYSEISFPSTTQVKVSKTPAENGYFVWGKPLSVWGIK